MTDGELFIQTLIDLSERVVSGEEYETLRASHLLRQLLIDGGNSLFSRANRQHRRKVRYIISDMGLGFPSNIPQPDIWFSWDSIEPYRSAALRGRRDVSIDKFLSTRVAIAYGHDYTIQDLIQYVAHVMGGVHSGNPNTEKEKVLEQIQDFILFKQLPAAVLFVQSAARATLRAMLPLAYDVLGFQRFEGQPALSVHLSATLARPDGAPNNIITLRSPDNIFAVSLFTSSLGEVTIQVASNNEVEQIPIGQLTKMYSFETPTYIAVYLGSYDSETLVRVDIGDWFRSIIIDKALDIPTSPLNLRIGSDPDINIGSKTLIYEVFRYRRALTSEEQIGVRDYFERRIDIGYSNGLRFYGINTSWLYDESVVPVAMSEHARPMVDPE